MDRAEPTREEWQRARVAALSFAISRTKSRQKAADVVHDAYEKTRTTRPWDAGRVSYEVHLVGVVRSLLSNERQSAASGHEEAAAEGFYDVVGRRTESFEVQLPDVRARLASGRCGARRALSRRATVGI